MNSMLQSTGIKDKVSNLSDYPILSAATHADNKPTPSHISQRVVSISFVSRQKCFFLMDYLLDIACATNKPIDSRIKAVALMKVTPLLTGLPTEYLSTSSVGTRVERRQRIPTPFAERGTQTEGDLCLHGPASSRRVFLPQREDKFAAGGFVRRDRAVSPCARTLHNSLYPPVLTCCPLLQQVAVSGLWLVLSDLICKQLFVCLFVCF